MIATDIPTALRAARRLPRRAARDARPGGDVRAGRQGRRSGRGADDMVGDRRRRRRALGARRAERAGLRRGSRPTCSPRAGAGAGDRRRRPPGRDRRRRRGSLAAARAARRRRARRWSGPAVARCAPAPARPSPRSPSGSARRCSTTLQGRGLLPLDHPCRVGLPPHLPEAGALWDEADLVLAVGTDFDGMMTQNWRDAGAAAADRDQRRPRRRGQELRARRRRWSATRALVARGARRRWRRRATRRRRLSPRGSGTPRREVASPRGGPAGAGSCSTRSRRRCRPTTVVVADMCIAGYWVGGFHRVRRPRRLAYPVGWGTLGFALPGRARRGARRRAGRRSASAATAASSSPAASWPRWRQERCRRDRR